MRPSPTALGSGLAAAQRTDGLFEFSTGEALQQILAETYFAVETLGALNRAVPQRAALTASLGKLAADDDAQVRTGNSTVGGRDTYELAVLDASLGSNNEGPLLADDASALVGAASIRNGVLHNIHDWYFAVLTLSTTHRLTAAVVDAVAAAGSDALSQVPLMPAASRLLALALIVDAGVNAGVALPPQALRSAASAAGLRTASPLRPTPASDLLTVFYTVVMTTETGTAATVDPAAVGSWLGSLRTGDGYAISAGQPSSPLGTMYGVELLSILKGGDARNVPR